MHCRRLLVKRISVEGRQTLNEESQPRGYRIFHILIVQKAETNISVSGSMIAKTKQRSTAYFEYQLIDPQHAHDFFVRSQILFIAVLTFTSNANIRAAAEEFCSTESERSAVDTSCSFLMNHVEKRQTQLMDLGYGLELVRGKMSNELDSWSAFIRSRFTAATVMQAFLRKPLKFTFNVRPLDSKNTSWHIQLRNSSDFNEWMS